MMDTLIRSEKIGILLEKEVNKIYPMIGMRILILESFLKKDISSRCFGNHYETNEASILLDTDEPQYTVR